MRVSAILVVNDRSGTSNDCNPADGLIPWKGPIASAEIMGQSVVERTAARMVQAGIRTISVIGGAVVPSLPRHPTAEVVVADNSFARWLAAQQTLREHGTRGMDTVLMVGLGAYVECNVADALKFHISRGASLTQIEDDQGALDFWVVDSKWFRTAATGCSLPFRYGEFPGLPVACRMPGYVNRLGDAHDFRRLVQDAFLGRCEIVPPGRAVRPGVWLDKGAQVHRLSRLVPPVYVGCRTSVGPSAVVTRFSNLERDCRIGEGTVVNEATVLPYTALGSGLEVSDAVVHGNQFADLVSNAAFQIDDQRLLCDLTPLNARVPRYRKFAAQMDHGKRHSVLDYSHGWSRAAGRLAEVFFKG